MQFYFSFQKNPWHVSPPPPLPSNLCPEKYFHSHQPHLSHDTTQSTNPCARSSHANSLSFGDSSRSSKFKKVSHTSISQSPLWSFFTVFFFFFKKRTRKRTRFLDHRKLALPLPLSKKDLESQPSLPPPSSHFSLFPNDRDIVQPTYLRNTALRRACADPSSRDVWHRWTPTSLHDRA